MNIFLPTCRHHLLLLIVVFGYLTGCSGVQTKSLYAETTTETALDADYYEVDIRAHDGTLLKATVFQPQLAAGKTAPLIIHSHGFGGFRADGPMSFYGQMIVSGEAAVAAWKAGYWVISYDHRGFGESEGKVKLMHPDYEVEDFSSVIDWAEDNLPKVTYENDDIVVGGVGESYGGGVQILASIKDPRIDAIVPITTWFDLNEIMAPKGHVKGAWGGILISGGIFSSFFDFDMAFDDEYMDLISGKMNSQVAADLAIRSPSHYCQTGKAIQSDALFIQGLRDTLMTFNQGYENWRCATQAGKDAKLVAIQDGHILPWPMQSWSGLPIFNTQESVTCGEVTFNTVDMIVSWYDEKLRKQPRTLPAIPDLCVTFSDDEGKPMHDIAYGGLQVPVRETEVKLMQSGWLEFLFEPAESLLSTIAPVGAVKTAEEMDTQGGWLRPAFIPLKMAEESQDMAGIPLISLQLSTTDSDKDGTVYVAIGIKEPGSPHIKVLGDQYTPLIGDGQYQMDLPAIAYQLKPGDVVGLVVQGFTAQYFLDPEGWFSFGTVSGSVQLPLHSSVALANHP